MCRPAKSQRGSTVLEFTLIGIPLIFILTATCEMGRGMWNYHTMAYAIKEGARYAVVHGKGCTQTGNSCRITVGTVARLIAETGVGLEPDNLDLTLDSASGSVPCQPLSSCFSNATAWPPAADAGAGMDIGITGRYRFRSALAMFWPGQGAMQIGTITFPATTRQTVQF